MTLGPNPFKPSLTLPTLAEIQCRTRELLAHHNRRKSAQASATPDEPDFEEDIRVLEEFMREHEEQHQGPKFQEPCAVEEPEPPAVLPPRSSAPPPPALDGTALHGIAGVLVRTLAPHTEADPAAVLLQFLAAFGNLLGPGPHCRVGATRHGLNLFVILVGESSKARKGTSWRQISSLFAEADPFWSSRCVTTTRPTPNTILQALRDQQPVTDRRLFLLCEEFASVIHVLGREAGQLSPLLRSAWDGGNLGSHDGHRYVQATSAHISIVGHVTQSELAHHLSRIESHNGFANRCLWTSVRRSLSLPDGGSLPPEQHSVIAGELRRNLDWVRSQDELLFSRTPAAREIWNGGYVALSQGREDAYGAATSRAEAQVLRLSAIYAALDRTPLIDACHLQAALAVWDYCRASARLLFDTAPIDPTAQRISQAADLHPEGLTRVQIRALFHRHVSKERIDLALEQLLKLGLIIRATSAGPGRATTLWTKPQNPQTRATPCETGPYAT
ncbi:MAG: DUF3987 domain-containing protein [Acidobacteriaceae bacterium]